MSIVGNRPLPVYEAELITAGDLSKGFSAWNYWFMASGTKRERRKMSENERMRLDNEYADQFTGDNYSFCMILNSYLELFQHYFKRVRLKNIDYHKIT
jgi:hypothetical protein